MVAITTTMPILGQLIPTFSGLQILLLVLLCVIATVLWRRSENLPPGPRALPIVGNVLSLIEDAAPLVLTNLAKKHGDVFTVYFGPVPAIVLSSYTAVHQALVANSGTFSSRPSIFSLMSLDEKSKGIGREPYGPKLKQHRKFAMSLMKLGDGKRSLEGKILKEARALGEEICRKSNSAFCVSQMAKSAVANVACSVVFNNRYDYDDVKFQDLLKALHKVFNATAVQYLPVLFRPLRFIPGFRNKYQEHRHNQAIVMDHVKARIREHKESFDPNDIRDFVDASLLESRKRQVDGSDTICDQQFNTIIVQLFMTSSVSPASAFHWALFYMILHLDIQDKVQREIDSVVGRDQDITMAHRSQMHYTKATLMEVYRLATGLPFAVPHATSKDTTFRGYNIPKDTAVIVNLWSVHHDPQVWPEPSRFDPTRFLDAAGNYVKKNEAIPFSIGPRTCTGEKLATMTNFLLLTSLLQRFTFKLPEGHPKPSDKGIFDGLHLPSPFELKAEPRK